MPLRVVNINKTADRCRTMGGIFPRTKSFLFKDNRSCAREALNINSSFWGAERTSCAAKNDRTRGVAVQLLGNGLKASENDAESFLIIC